MRRLDQRDPESARPHGKPIPQIKFRARSAFHHQLCRLGGLLATTSSLLLIFQSGAKLRPKWAGCRNYRERQYFGLGALTPGGGTLPSLRAEKTNDDRRQKRRRRRKPGRRGSRPTHAVRLQRPCHPSRAGSFARRTTSIMSIPGRSDR